MYSVEKQLTIQVTLEVMLCLEAVIIDTHRKVRKVNFQGEKLRKSSKLTVGFLINVNEVTTV